ALGLVTHSPRFDAVACVGSLVREEASLRSLPDLRRAIADSDTAVVFYSYTRPTQTVISGLTELGIPCYPTPDRAARSLAWAAWYRAFLDSADEVAVLAERSSSTWPARADLPSLGIRSSADGAVGNEIRLTARRDSQFGPLVEVGLGEEVLMRLA